MKLWLVRRTDRCIGHDEAVGFVVAAKSPRGARRVASRVAGDEGGDFWRHSAKVNAKQIARESLFTEEHVVLRHFVNG